MTPMFQTTAQPHQKRPASQPVMQRDHGSGGARPSAGANRPLRRSPAVTRQPQAVIRTATPSASKAGPSGDAAIRSTATQAAATQPSVQTSVAETAANREAENAPRTATLPQPHAAWSAGPWPIHPFPDERYLGLQNRLQPLRLPLRTTTCNDLTCLDGSPAAPGGCWNLPHPALLLHVRPKGRPSGAPRAPGDGVWAAWSRASDFTPRPPPAAAEQPALERREHLPWHRDSARRAHRPK
jgi:hypothetical protein